jgi:hypothetical protein
MIVWDELSLDERLKSAGDAQKLTHLLQLRDDMPREDASKYVMGFCARYRAS